MSRSVRSRASADSSFSASSRHSWTNFLMMLFAPRAERAPAEAAGEALDAGEADAVDLGRVAVEHGDAGVGEDLLDLVLLARLVVVVAEHADHGNLDDRGDLAGEARAPPRAGRSRSGRRTARARRRSR